MGSNRVPRLGNFARLFRAASVAPVQLISRDRTMILTITEPAFGFTLSLDGHVCLFDSRLETTGNLHPPAGHTSIFEGAIRGMPPRSEPEKLAGAVGFEPTPSALTVRCPTGWTTPQQIQNVPFSPY